MNVNIVAENPLISVVIPTYNRAPLLVEAVESVLRQTFDNFEILVVDDGSTDDTKERLKTYTERIRYFYQPNAGVSSARNLGIRESRGALIAFLDSDDTWHSEKLKVQAEYLHTHSEIGLVYCGIELLGHSETRAEIKRRRPLQGKRTIADIFEDPYLVPSSTVVRRTIFERIGMFNPLLKTAEDVDFFLRVAMKFPIAFIDRNLVTKRILADCISEDLRSYEDLLRVLKMYVEQHPDFAEENRKLVSSVFAEVLVDYGEDLLWKGMPGKARTVLLESARKYPTKRAWMLFLKSFTPLFLFKFARGTGNFVDENPRQRHK